MDFRFGLIVLLCLVGLTYGKNTKFFNCGKLHNQENSLTWLLSTALEHILMNLSLMQYLSKKYLKSFCLQNN